MNSLAGLLGQLSSDDYTRGKQFERICKWYLENDPSYSHLSQVWLWDAWPGYWGPDAGIDLVAQDHDGRYWAIQAKAYAPKYAIKKRDVDKFLSESSRAQISYRLLIGTTDRIDHRAEKTLYEQEKPVTFVGLSKLEAAQVNWPASLSDFQPPPLPPKRPEGDWAYQGEAVDAVVEGFKKSDRGQMIMACGTGKTLVALFAKEKLAADRTLMLAPSLSLLSQTLREWTANATSAFEYLPVCSDETVDDSIVMSARDLGDRVTTDPMQIVDFLRGPGPRVVFATYQSSPSIAEAFGLGGIPPFDLVVADEAHRTAGPGASMFATVLDNEKIQAKRRLFMTATPRYFAGSVISEAAALNYGVASMDDETTYGPVFHRLAFAEAIERGLLTDYQVVVIGVDDVERREMVDKAHWVESDGIRGTHAHTLAAQIGLAKAMSHYDLRRVISFHSLVESARRFSRSLPEVISWMPDDQRPTGQVWADYISGAMTANQRNVRLGELRTIDADHRGLLSNARCLTEGVDVPTLDGVVFVDPKRSEVDIVQAVGRAIRLADDKTVGTIVIPVFMASDADHETVLDDSSFKTVWAVIKALRMHDEELAEQLDSLRLGLGHRGAGQPRLPEKIHLDLPTRISVDFARVFDTRLVSSVTAPWLEWFGMLQQYYDDNGTTRVPRDHPLNSWMRTQRLFRRKGKLSADRVEKLSNLGDWSWEPFDEKFEKYIEELQEYFKVHGTTRVPLGSPLGNWVGNQRAFNQKGKLSAERIERLSKIGDWSWEPRDDQWQKMFEVLQEHFETTGTTRTSANYKTPDGDPLGSWANTQRTLRRRGTLSAERIELLNSLDDWSWEPRAGRWPEWFRLLQRYFEDTGTTRVPDDYKTPGGQPLGNWVGMQRTKYRTGKLSADRIQLLKNLGDWSWEPHFANQWMEWFGKLQEYFDDNGTARVPDDCPLGTWVGAQRILYRKGKLSDDRIQLLKSLGDWSWEPNEDQWMEMLGQLRKHFEATGTTHVRPGTPLGNWVTNQRAFYKRNKLSAERIELLKNLGDWSWGRHDDRWKKMFGWAEKYFEDNGTVYAHYTYRTPDGYSLYTWIRNQLLQYSKNRLPADRIGS